MDANTPPPVPKASPFPPSPTAPSRATWVALLVVKGFLWSIIILLTLLLIVLCDCSPAFHRMNDGDRQVAVSNMKRLYASLEEFRKEFGSYPCDATAEMLTDRFPEYDFGELRGDNANAYLRQLFYLGENSPYERNFYARSRISGGGSRVREGDQKLHRRALEAGENGMSYVLRLGEGGRREGVRGAGGEDSMAERTPLLICALYPQEQPSPGQALHLDNSSFRGHVYVLYTDGRVEDLADRLEEDEEDEEDEDKAHLIEAGSLFPTLPDGSSSAAQHTVLSPLF